MSGQTTSLRILLTLAITVWSTPLFATQATSTYLFFPVDHLYPHYLANPLRSSFSFQMLNFSASDIPQSSHKRFDLNLGGTFGILRRHPRGQSNLGWQLSIEAGFRGQFDTEYSEDNLGWDGLYALFLDYRPSQQLAFRFGFHHTSSHIGDEFAERTGRQRINYTRQEIRLGTLWNFAQHWQTYAEVANGYDLRNSQLQKPGRFEGGIQYDHKTLFNPHLGGYAALDISGYAENDWQRNISFQAGISWPAKERHWRLGLEYYDGRSQLGEFFQYHEHYLGIGIWLDL